MRCRSLLAGIVLLAGVAGVCPAQATLPPRDPAFEVSTIKPTPAVNDGHTHINYPSGGDFSASNVTLLDLVSWSFDLPQKRIAKAPGWMTTQHFDLQAKTDKAGDERMRALPGDEANAAKRRMVQALLQDRFALKVHHETQTLSALDLVVDGTPKLVESKANGKQWNAGRTSLRGYGLTTDTLAEQLSRVAGRVVVNRTGLTGVYDVSLQWAADDGSSPDANLPGFFRAVPEQLGLKLVPAKEPLDVLVVDAVSQPAAN